MSRYTVWTIPRSAWTERPDLERLVISERVIAAFVRDEAARTDPRAAAFDARRPGDID